MNIKLVVLLFLFLVWDNTPYKLKPHQYVFLNAWTHPDIQSFPLCLLHLKFPKIAELLLSYFTVVVVLGFFFLVFFLEI